MTILIEQIEAMRIRMNELAAEEPAFVRMLGDALETADQRLVEELRSGAANEGAIVGVLQKLAGRMSALYRSQGPFAALENILQEEPLHGTGPAMRGGDWRQATANIQEI
jgi:hypothetical protein